MAQVIVSGAERSLYHLAAKQLGDPLQWYRIAQANGLSDPILAGVVTLTIPGPAATDNDGVPPQ